MPPSSGESSSKLPALSPSHGKVAPLKPKKTLSTLGGRKVSPSGDIAKASKQKNAESGSAKVVAAAVAPPRRTLWTARK